MKAINRVVVTGIGFVSPLGCGAGADIALQRLLEYPSPQESLHFRPVIGFPDNYDKNNSKFVRYALHASDLALESANLRIIPANLMERSGVAIGTGGMSSLRDIVDQTSNPLKISPYFIPRTLVGMAAGSVSIKYGLKGPVHSVATACAAGTHSIGDAFNFIRLAINNGS